MKQYGKRGSGFAYLRVYDKNEAIGNEGIKLDTVRI